MNLREFQLDTKGHLDDILVNPDLDNVLAASHFNERLDIKKVEEIAAGLIEKAKESDGNASEKVEITSSTAPTPFTHQMRAHSDDQAWIVAHDFLQQVEATYKEPERKWLAYVKRCTEANHALVYTRPGDAIETKVQKMKDLSLAISNTAGIDDFPVIDVSTKMEVKQSSRIEDVVTRWPR